MMPDVCVRVPQDFVVSSLDRPLELICQGPGCVDEPVFRFCKSDLTSGILIPDMHFYAKV